MKRRVISLLSALLLGAACQPPAELTPDPIFTPAQPAPTIQAALDQAFTVARGQSISLASEGLTLRFKGVAEDSRCPTRVNCVWIGRATIGVVVSGRDQPELAHSLSTRSDPYPTDRLFYLDYEVTLKDLTPRPEWPGTPVAPERYVATFVVSQRPVTADCPARPDDPNGYLNTICRYVRDRQLNVAPADPATYHIKRTEEQTQNNRGVVWVFLNCCGLGDIAVIDRATGEVIEFRKGAY
ncbi:MAG: hypothetical protein HY870_06300 [Chloroflexi bacterium]|nr:hypothetical protein [Chloroflexota bacterium]